MVSGSYFVHLESTAVDQAQGPEQNICREDKEIYLFIIHLLIWQMILSTGMYIKQNTIPE